MKILNLCIVTLMVSGCSLVPYENEFSCQLEDNYGKCINVESAYEEAVTGVEQYPHMQKASDRNRQARDERAVSGSSRVKEQPIGARQTTKTPETAVQVIAPEPSAYSGYRDAVYDQLGSLVAQPRTPMIKPPRAVRTMILPYSSELKKDRLYMPRFIYSIVDEPRFVMGQYLYRKPELTESLIDSVRENKE
tara:strand:- start:7535 stop:8110 length:576 start_codon:yes stop_codon:yes gene_type:complete